MVLLDGRRLCLDRDGDVLCCECVGVEVFVGIGVRREEKVGGRERELLF